MALRGIEFHTEESPQAIVKSSDGTFSLKTNKGTVEGFSHIMFATGRKPNTRVSSCFFLVNYFSGLQPLGYGMVLQFGSYFFVVLFCIFVCNSSFWLSLLDKPGCLHVEELNLYFHQIS